MLFRSEKRQGQRVPREQVAGFEPSPGATHAEVADEAEASPSGKLPPGTGGIKGKRKSKKDKLREAAAAVAASAPSGKARA